MSISIHHLTYTHPDKEVLFEDISLSIHKGEKVSLIGNNGSGKSTLLKIIAGLLSPTGGDIHLPASGIYYVPQHFGQYNQLSIAQAMQIDKKLEALQAITEGRVDEDYFAILNDDWEIEENAKAALAYWGLEAFALNHPMQELSGGEKTKVFLAGMKIHNESTILLDEPTNHLDYVYRTKLYDLIRQSKSTIIVVSHDRTLLNLLPQTCELLHNEIKTYGGNYEFYKEQKTLAGQAMLQKLEEKEKEIRMARKTAREVAERQQKHSVRGEKQNLKKGVPRIAMGNLKNKSEISTAKLKDIHTDKMADLQGELKDIQKAMPLSLKLKTDFNASTLHSGKILITTTDVNFGYNGTLLWKEPLTFQMRSGERWAIEGANGSGKTSLLKLITGQAEPQRGTIIRSDGFSHVYLDQEYSLIQNGLTLLEQAEHFKIAGMKEHELKIILNRFLFPADTWDKPCSKLSGGEKMRLAFCCLMVGNNTPDMFILDEPTNNLDIQSIEIITSTIKEYAGTVVVVSHDNYFVGEIGVEKKILLV